MQFPGDATIASVDAAPGTWLVGARPGAGARTVARAFGARAIGGGDYVVERSKARAMAGALRSRGLLLYAQPDAIRRTKQAVPDDPLSGSPNAWRAAVADPDIAPPPVTETSPLIALLDTRLDETHPEFGGSNVAHPRQPAAGQPARHRDRGGRRRAAERRRHPRRLARRAGAQRAAAARRADLLGLGQGRARGDPRRRRRDQHELRLPEPLPRRVQRDPARRPPRHRARRRGRQRVRRRQPARVPGLAAARADHRRGQRAAERQLASRTPTPPSTSARPASRS